MILQDKNVLIFAATGAIASGVAHKFAAEGATLFLSGRDETRLTAVADQLAHLPGRVAGVDVVDATSPEAVAAYVQQVVGRNGRIDATFNGIGARPIDLGYPARATTQPLDDFMIPLNVILGSTFLTSRTVGAQMVQQGHGAIVTLSATLSGMTAGYMAGISAACGAIEALTRSLAGEFGPAGVRVNCVRGSGMPETRTIQETVAGQIELSGQPPSMALPPLGRPITVAETAAAAAFLASDQASGMTGQVITVCAGAFV